MNLEINVYLLSEQIDIGIFLNDKQKQTNIKFTDSLDDIWNKLSKELGFVMITNNSRNYSNSVYDAIQSKDWNKMDITITDLGITITPDLFDC